MAVGWYVMEFAAHRLLDAVGTVVSEQYGFAA